MTRIKNRILIVLSLVMLIVIGSVAFAACGGKSDYTVTFMVRENGASGEWQEYGKADADDDGSVTLPADPTVDGYVFRDWYKDEACTGEVFDENTKVTADITVYALMVEAEVTLSVTDGEGNTKVLESGSLAGLSATTAAQEAAAAAVDLTFDGWYTDTAFTQKYSDGVDAAALYGRYMAQIVYDNGYETLFTELVTPGGKTAAPDGRADGFVKRYMDGEDISYVDSEGNAIDFSVDAFDKNETVTVLWKTPGLSYSEISGQSGKYCVSGIDGSDYASYPAISVLSGNVTMKNGGKGDVVAVDTFAFIYCTSAEIFIFNEGIESIAEFYPASSGAVSSAKEVRLPSTLKVIEDSFNMLGGSLTSLELPEGLEVIIDCFWSDMLPAVGVYRENGQNIEITVPSTVTNMAVIPKNLDLSRNGRFEYDDAGRLYHTDGDGKILCSEYQSHVIDGRLAVEEGVTGVQVYLLSTLDFDYLDLPSTFCEVGYNNAAEAYPAYTGKLLTPQSVINNPDAEPSGANRNSYAIVSDLEKITYVTINRTDMPVSDYAFVSSSGVPHNGSTFENDVKLVLIGDVPTGAEVQITVTVYFSRDKEVRTQKLTGYKSGDAFTVAELLEEAGVSADQYNVVVSNVGKEYKGGVLTSDLYITVECYAKVGGFTYTVNADGETATVTGWDLSSAEQLVDGSYRVFIDMINGCTVTAIADGAFKNVNGVSEVYIANTVKTIGAEAFMNASGLRLVDIAPGGLETIGESAFENAGCVQDASGNWIVNTDGGVTKLTMILPLAELVDIRPYAFKTKAIKEFTAAGGEEERDLTHANEAVLKEGAFLFAINGNGKNRGIVKYTGINETKAMKDSSDADVEITVHGVQLVAVAGGGDFSNASTGLALGFSYRYFDTFAEYVNPLLSNNVYEFEIMEGSVYFGGENMAIYIGLVSKVHENAFTDMEDSAPKVYYYNCSYDQYMTIEQVQTQDSEIFEEGWFEGSSNSENTFMEETEVQTSKYPLM